MGAINSDNIQFPGDLGRRITRITDDKRDESALAVLTSVSANPALYNSVVIQGTFAHTTLEDEF